VNGKRTDITREDLLTVAKAMNIKKAAAIIDEVKAGVRKWKSFTKQAAMPTKQVEMIGRMHQVRI